MIASNPIPYAVACIYMMQTANTGSILLPDSPQSAYHCREIAREALKQGKPERVRVLPIIETITDHNDSEEIGREVIQQILEQAMRSEQAVPSVAAIGEGEHGTVKVIAATASFDGAALGLEYEDGSYSAEDIRRSDRLHELIDREFLQILTEAEAQELTELRAWRSKLKSDFYKNIPLAQEEGP